MSSETNLRLRIAGLYLVAFLGMVMHIVMAIFDMALSLMKTAMQMTTENMSVDQATTNRFADVLKELSTPAMPVIMFLFIVLSLLIAVLPLVTEIKAFRWVTAVIGALLTLMNLLDGGGHIFQGEIINGLYTLVISGGVGIAATVLSFKWVRQ